MKQSPPALAAANAAGFADADDISDQGERVSHLRRDAGYWAHLSLYDYAVPLCRGGLVLDAGAGAGYGSAYLVDQGARHVDGIDASPKAVAFSRHHFPQPNLTFQEMGLDHIDGFPPEHFDLIYSSNTLEHVAGIPAFLAAAHRLLKPDGSLFVAVPPITDDRLQYLNLINPYHVNLWSPRQWAYTLGLYFADIQPVLHGVLAAGGDFKPEHFTPALTLTEKSFVFTPGTVEDMYHGFTLTAIFLARTPRPQAQLPPAGAPVQFVDDSFTRPVGTIDPDLRLKLKKYFDLPSPPYTLPGSTADSRPGFFVKIGKALRRLSGRG